MKHLNLQSAHRANLKFWQLAIVTMLALMLVGCGEVDDDDGDTRNTVPLPTDDTIPFSFYCEDMGIFDNTCVLEDPNNPYRFSIVSEDTKFDLDADAPSETARFYVWATALARGAGIPGENQFYVALALHRMWAASTSETTRLQALRAYQSYLDNYFDSLTIREEPADSGNFVPRSLNQGVGQMLFDPTDVGNVFGTSTRLFNPADNINRDMAALEISMWGYLYDQTTEVFTSVF